MCYSYRYSDSLHPTQSGKHRMRLRHSSSDFSRKRHSKQKRVESPLRRSTREKRFVFATFKASDMIKQIEGQHDFPEFESEVRTYVDMECYYGHNYTVYSGISQTSFWPNLK